MNYLIVDDNPIVVEDLTFELGRIDPNAVCFPFTNAAAAHQFALSAPPGSIHAALLDIQMPNMNGLTLAKAMSVTVQTVGRWEQGTRVPDLATIAHLAQVLGVNLETLMIV